MSPDPPLPSDEDHLHLHDCVLGVEPSPGTLPIIVGALGLVLVTRIHTCVYIYPYAHT